MTEDFAALWTAGLAHCHGRFADCRGALSRAPHGGIGCFTPDSPGCWEPSGQFVQGIWADQSTGAANARITGNVLRSLPGPDGSVAQVTYLQPDAPIISTTDTELAALRSRWTAIVNGPRMVVVAGEVNDRRDARAIGHADALQHVHVPARLYLHFDALVSGGQFFLYLVHQLVDGILNADENTAIDLAPLAAGKLPRRNLRDGRPCVHNAFSSAAFHF